ncbi:MAG: hypothetical protein IPM29_01675 [Planctomycetes bacterium]|nr:hypothetical protein [Planctomycetota bacterium]
MMPDSLRGARVALVGASFVVLSGSLSAQPPSNWTTTTLPANAIGAPSQIGTSASIQTTDSVWLYSGITKTWSVLPVTNPSLVFQANDYLVIQDGNRLHGFATHVGTVDTITTPSATPQIVSGSASSSWVTLVADGTQAWAFGAFHGRWETVTLSQPSPAMVASRLTGLLQDGSTIYGVSAHHGTFVPVVADPQAQIVVVGEAEVGTASSPGVFRAFSAQQNRWATQAVPVTTTPVQDAEVAMVYDGAQAWAFSGITGTLDSYRVALQITNLQLTAGIIAFQDGPFVVCYGSGTGRFVPRVSTPNAAFHVAYHLAIVTEGGAQYTPFSALLGAYGPSITGAYTLDSNDAIAYADGGAAGSYAYSPILNAWSAVPIASPSAVELVRDAVVLVEPSGYRALSARYGRWIPLTTTLPSSYLTSRRGSTFVALDGAGETAHVFDARLDRWATIVGQAPLTVNISRHTAMAHDGRHAYGFGQPSGEWYTVPLTAAPSSFRTSSSIGTVIHGNQVSVYSVQGSFTYTGRFPEFTQAINLGNTLRLHQAAPAGSAFAVVLGFAPAWIDLGPTLGRLYMDPVGLVSLPWSAPVSAAGLAELALPVPLDPALRSTRLHFQDLVFPPAGQPWLSSSVAPILF